jgi:glycosyltransferase involved in cell wall biosynthesis
MKVLHISKYYPPVLGGIESVAWELVQGANLAGVRTDVLCSNQQALTTSERAAAGYDITRAASWGTWLSTSMAPALAVELRRVQARYDVIHVHMPDPMAALAVWLCRPRAKLVVHWHSDVIRQRLALRVYEPLQRWLLQKADAIVATSPPYAQASPPLQAWQDKVQVIPIGISDLASEACSRQAAAIRQHMGEGQLVFALGRMTYYKGFDVLIDAFASLPEGVRLMIGGEGELHDTLKQQVRARGLQHRVHLLGHVPDDQLASHFEACDLFCMSSTVRAEAYGVAMLEAMMMGKPVVATDIAGSGVPWVNQHGITGLNVPAGSAGALASALGQLLGNEELRVACGTQARQRYLNEFTAERMVQQTLALYRKVHAI